MLQHNGLTITSKMGQVHQMCSVLGPILFLVYINDLPEQVKSRVRLFADDTAMYLALSSHIEGQVLQNDLLSLEKWEKMWDMNFNPSKCQVLHVTRLKTPIETKYFLHNTMLDSVSSAKYLKVTISDDLSWSTHIDNINQECKSDSWLPKKKHSGP